MQLKRLIKRSLNRLKQKLGLAPADQKLARPQYKTVWNTYSGTEDEARLVVADYTDEKQLVETAEMFLVLLKETVGINPSDRVLEIGAGVGRLGRVLASLCAEWTGADVSENMVNHIRNRLADLKNVKAFAPNGYDLSPIPANSVDLVYCIVVFMHLEEWERYSIGQRDCSLWISTWGMKPLG